MKRYLKDILEIIGIVTMYIFVLAFTLGIIYAIFAIPTYFIIQIIEAIKS